MIALRLPRDRAQSLPAQKDDFLRLLDLSVAQAGCLDECSLYMFPSGLAVCSYILPLVRCILQGSIYQTCRLVAEISPPLHAKLHQACGTALATPRFNAVSTAKPFVERLFLVRERTSLHFTHLHLLKLSHSKTAKYAAQRINTFLHDQLRVCTTHCYHTSSVSQQHLRCAKILSSDWFHSRDDVHPETGTTGVSL